MMDAFEHGTTTESTSQRMPRSQYTPEDRLLIDRWFARLPVSRTWAIAIIGLVLVLVPAILAYWNDVTDLATLNANYRAQFIYAVIVVYVLSIIPLLERSSEGAVQSLRPVTQLDDGAFQAVVAQASVVRPAMELLAFAVGMAIGLTINVLFEPLPDSPSRLDVYAYWSRVGIFGVIGWICYSLPINVRVTNALLKQPMEVDPFDLTPFEPIGRQSMLLSLTVLGGAILSLLSASLQNRSLWVEYFIVYGIAVIGIFILFFWSMRGVHHLLSATKRRHLDSIERNIARAYADLQRCIAGGQATLAVATELNALVAAKQQLRETRTWPFNTETLSTLSVAVLTPLFIGFARILAVLLEG